MVRGPGGLVLLSNKTLAAVAEFAIALKDLIGPDPDIEPDFNEDDALLPCWSNGVARDAFGAGCPIADPGGCEHDGSEEDQGEAAMHYGIDQTRGIGPDNPAVN
jgi:hypothetical protein